MQSQHYRILPQGGCKSMDMNPAPFKHEIWSSFATRMEILVVKRLLLCYKDDTIKRLCCLACLVIHLTCLFNIMCSYLTTIVAVVVLDVIFILFMIIITLVVVYDDDDGVNSSTSSNTNWFLVLWLLIME